MNPKSRSRLVTIWSGLFGACAPTVVALAGSDISHWGFQATLTSSARFNLHQTDQRGCVELDAGYYHTIVRRMDGTVACIGGGAVYSTAWSSSAHFGQSAVPKGLGAVKQVSAGGWHSVALRFDGTVVGWGENFFGGCAGTGADGKSIGGSIVGSVQPVQIRGAVLSGVVEVSGGAQYTLARLQDGRVIGWGLDKYGEVLGSPASGGRFGDTAWGSAIVAGSAPVQIGGVELMGVQQISAGYKHGAAILLDGGVVCWGVGFQNSGTDDFGQSLVPADLIDVQQVVAGDFHTAALRGDGTVACWGAGTTNTGTGEAWGQSMVPSGLNDVVRIATAYQHTLALRSDGSVVAWGGRDPVAVTPPADLSDVVSVAGGDTHSAALTSNGELVIWGPKPLATGSNSNGAMAIKGVLVDRGSSVQVSTGQKHAIACLEDGTVMAWGENAYGQCLGSDGSGQPILGGADHVRAQVQGVTLDNVKQVAAGGTHSLALRTNGSVVAWGLGSLGQTAVPSGLPEAISIAAGQSHSMALCADRQVRCWGANASGQSAVPPGLYDVAYIAAGEFHSLAVRSDGSVVCWGRNSSGECSGSAGGGQALTSEFGDGVPVRILGRPLLSVRDVAGGGAHSLALLSNGTVVGWGSNALGQCLGTGTNGAALNATLTGTPVRLGGQILSGVEKVAAGTLLSAALKSDGTIVCWGSYALSATSRPAASIDTPSGRKGFHALAAGWNQIAALQTWDCDRNGQYDAQEIFAGQAVDLDGDGRPDTCQGAVEFDGGLEVSGAPSANVPTMHVFSDLPRADSDVQTIVTAKGDFDAPTEWLLVRANGQTLQQRAFELDGVNCSAGENVASFTTSAADFNASIEASGRSCSVQTIPSPGVSAAECPDGFISARLRYRGFSPSGDCDGDGVLDVRQIAAAPGLDRDRNGRLDTCDIALNPALDEDRNGSLDSADIAANPAIDCDGNLRIDALEILADPWLDCDQDALLDRCQITSGARRDFDRNGRPDPCDIANDPSLDRNLNGLLDAEDIALNPALDCDSNLRLDSFEIVDDPSRDCDANGVLDRCTVATGSAAKALAWGFNDFGQAQVPAAAVGARAIAGGDWHSLALMPDGTVLAWGANGAGQRDVPAGLGNVVEVVGGGYHSAALVHGGTVVMWGMNTYGQCSAPTGLGSAVRIGAGFYTTTALEQAGRLVTWGWNGVGTCDVPANLGVVRSFACGGYHTLVLHPSGTVTAWGLDTDGQSSTPPALREVVQVAGGGWFSAALTSDGRVSCWGNNDSRQTEVPPGLVGVQAISAGGSHCLALLRDGSVVGWGAGKTRTTTNPEYGQLIFPFGGMLELGRTLGSHCLAISRPGDVNANGRPDACDLLADPTLDCNGNAVIDTLEIQRDPSIDCDANARIDACEILAGQASDCDANGRIDACDIAAGATDEDLDGRMDVCELATGDLDMNNEIDYGDVVIVLLYFGERDMPFGDLDGSGLIDFGDIAVLLMNFGPVPWP